MADRNAPPVYTSRGRIEGEDWPAVAAALNERMAALRVGQQELAHLSGVSVSTLRQVQHGAGRRVQNKTLSAISRALDWPDNHLTGVLISDRCEPVAETSPGSDDVAATLHRVEERLQEVVQQLAHLTAAITARTDLSEPASGQPQDPGRRRTSKIADV